MPFSALHRSRPDVVTVARLAVALADEGDQGPAFLAADFDISENMLLRVAAGLRVRSSVLAKVIRGLDERQRRTDLLCREAERRREAAENTRALVVGLNLDEAES